MAALSACDFGAAQHDIYAPVTGTVEAVNDVLDDTPETINEDAFGKGWMFTIKIEDRDQLNDMLGPDAYTATLEDDDS